MQHHTTLRPVLLNSNPLLAKQWPAAKLGAQAATPRSPAPVAPAPPSRHLPSGGSGGAGAPLVPPLAPVASPRGPAPVAPAAPPLPTRQRSGIALLRRATTQMLAVEEGRDALMDVRHEDSDAEAVSEEEAPKPARNIPEAATFLGVDTRPFKPLALFSSTFLGALCMLTVQRSMVQDVFGSASLFGLFFGVLYAVTLCCMTYTALCDPGLVPPQWVPGDPLPRRAHKAWLYRRPVLRFDHYCRWLTNVIGLRNHREFMVMVGGLTVASLLGVVVDCFLLAARLVMPFEHGAHLLLLLLHLACSAGVGKYAAQIFGMHVGFVARNELAKEWQKDNNYVLRFDDGSVIPAKELSADQYEEHEDDFEYDSARNPWDRGWRSNCLIFWTSSRWAPDQLGEF